MKELKYIFLKAKLENQERNLDRDDFYKTIEHKVGWREYNQILQESVQNKLLDYNTHNQLTELGKARLNDLERELSELSTDNQAQRQKLYNDTIISGWKRKTFWWIFGLAILGSALSIYNFINDLKTTSSNIKLEKRIQNIESKINNLEDFDIKQRTDSLN